MILAVGARPARAPHGLYRSAILVAVVALVSHAPARRARLRAALLARTRCRRASTSGPRRTWSDLAFALPARDARLHRPRDGREPRGRDARARDDAAAQPVRRDRRSWSCSFAVAIVGLVGLSRRSPTGGPDGWPSDLGTTWLRAPLVGITAALDGELPAALVDVAARLRRPDRRGRPASPRSTTSISGAGRLAYSLGQREMLPHAFGAPEPPDADRAGLDRELARRRRCALLVIAAAFIRPSRCARSRASSASASCSRSPPPSWPSSGCASRSPDLERPFRAPGNVRIRGVARPARRRSSARRSPSRSGSSRWRPTTRRASPGPLWLARRCRHLTSSCARSRARAALRPRRAGRRRPRPRGRGHLRADPRSDEARPRSARRCSRPRSGSREERRCALVALACGLGSAGQADRRPDARRRRSAPRPRSPRPSCSPSEHGVEVEAEIVRARAIGEAIVDAGTARRRRSHRLGSAPRWRRQSRFFSPTVDYVLRHAPCEVMVIAYPQGVLEEEEAEALSG